MKRLYISDLDGTLLSPKPEITAHTAEIMNALAESKKFTTSYKTKMQNPVIHDLVVLLFVYFVVC